MAALASAVRVQSVPLPTGMEAFLERLRPGLGTLAPVLTGYGLETEADFAQLQFDDVAAEEVWALLEANGCKRLQARAILKGMGLDPDLLDAPGASSIGVVVGRERLRNRACTLLVVLAPRVAWDQCVARAHNFALIRAGRKRGGDEASTKIQAHHPGQ